MLKELGGGGDAGALTSSVVGFSVVGSGPGAARILVNRRECGVFPRFAETMRRCEGLPVTLT